MSAENRPADDDLAPGARQAAVTLIGLGKAAAAKVIAQLDPDEAAVVTKALLALDAVQAEEIRASLVDLAARMGKLADVSAPTSWVTEVLTEAVGPGKALDLVQAATRPAPFTWMLGADVDALVTVLESESPATVAIVLSHLDEGLGGKLLRKLSPGHRDAAAARVAQLEAIPEAALRAIDDALTEQVGKVIAAPSRAVDGVGRLASLLGRVPRRDSDAVLDTLRAADPRRAAKVKDEMFTFLDVLALEPRYLQKVLAAVEVRTLAVAIHGASEAEVETVFTNLPERIGANLAEEIDFLGPVRAADVRAARREVVAVCGSLEAEGTVQRTDHDDEDEDDTTTGDLTATPAPDQAGTGDTGTGEGPA